MRTWFSVWGEVLADAADAARLVAAATDAVQKHPAAAELYVALGRGYERMAPPQPLKARVCYERVLDLAAPSEVAERAKTALAALAK